MTNITESSKERRRGTKLRASAAPEVLINEKIDLKYLTFSFSFNKQMMNEKNVSFFCRDKVSIRKIFT